jgi:hypothetical protein
VISIRKSFMALLGVPAVLDLVASVFALRVIGSAKSRAGHRDHRDPDPGCHVRPVGALWVRPVI